MMRFALLSLALVALAAADPIPWTKCGTGDTMTISTLDATPWPPVKGQDITLTADGSLSTAFSAANYDITLKLGIIKKSFKGDLCAAMSKANLTCPIAAGPVSLKLSEKLPTDVPSATYSVTATATDGAGNQILCAQIQLKIGDADELLVNDETEIERINGVQSSWTAGSNDRFENMTVAQIKAMMGTRMEAYREGAVFPAEESEGIPTTFDARKQWPKCVHEIRNQEQCGSCWAFGASEALSDRLCIATKGKTNVVLSPEELVSCDTGNMGCQGGYLNKAWEFMEKTGLPSDKCFPYTAGTGHEAACRKTCTSKSEKFVLHKVKAGSSVNYNSEVAIQKAIMSEGPIEVAFTVYQDFMQYKSGVYKHTSSQVMGGHAVKAVGWGVEGGQKYWLIANSWGTTWGLKGYFKILRGTNECGIESQGYAGTPAIGKSDEDMWNEFTA